MLMLVHSDMQGSGLRHAACIKASPTRETLEKYASAEALNSAGWFGQTFLRSKQSASKKKLGWWKAQSSQTLDRLWLLLCRKDNVSPKRFSQPIPISVTKMRGVHKLL